MAQDTPSSSEMSFMVALFSLPLRRPPLNHFNYAVNASRYNDYLRKIYLYCNYYTITAKPPIGLLHYQFNNYAKDFALAQIFLLCNYYTIIMIDCQSCSLTAFFSYVIPEHADYYGRHCNQLVNRSGIGTVYYIIYKPARAKK